MTQEAHGTNGLDATAQQWADRHASYPLVAVDKARATATDLGQQLRSLVNERPMLSVFAAAGLGYFFARLLARGVR